MKKSNITKLDKAWAYQVKIKSICEHCGKVTHLNAHHYYSRSIRSVRWDVSNGFCLCVGCHVFSTHFSAHKTPAEFVEWALERRGQEWYNKLKDKKNSLARYKDFDVEDILLDIQSYKF